MHMLLSLDLDRGTLWTERQESNQRPLWALSRRRPRARSLPALPARRLRRQLRLHVPGMLQVTFQRGHGVLQRPLDLRVLRPRNEHSVHRFDLRVAEPLYRFVGASGQGERDRDPDSDDPFRLHANLRVVHRGQRATKVPAQRSSDAVGSAARASSRALQASLSMYREVVGYPNGAPFRTGGWEW